MSTEPSAYQQAIAAEVRAAGHSAEWMPSHISHRLLLMIDGRSSGYEERRKGHFASSVEAVGFMEPIRWRARKLAEDPKKAAASLLERLAVAIQARQDADERVQAQASRAALEEQLRAAFQVPNGFVRVESSAVKVELILDSLTPDKALRLATAINGVLGEEKTK